MTMSPRIRTLAAAALVAAALAAVTGPAARAQTVAIVGGTVYPVSGPRIERGTVLIRDGRIAAVGANVAVPAGATTIDATGKWVTPGLVNAATAVGLVEVDGVQQTVDYRATGEHGIAASFAMIDGLNPASEMIPQTRAGGVTSIVMVPFGELVFGQAAAIDLVAGPASGFVVKAPAAMVAQVASAARANLGARGELIGRLRGLFDDVRIYMRRPTDYDRGDLHHLSAAPRELAALVPVVSGREPLLLYADRASDIENAIRLGHDYGIKIIIGGGAEAWRVAPALAAAHVPVLTGTLDNAPESFSTLGQRQDNAALLPPRGGRGWCSSAMPIPRMPTCSTRAISARTPERRSRTACRGMTRCAPSHLRRPKSLGSRTASARWLPVVRRTSSCGAATRSS